MVPYLGDYAEDATVYVPFNTFDSNDPSASSTITDLANTDIHVHKDGGATQLTTTGATVSVDFDTITGNHLVTIDTSASAEYTTGSDYQVRMEGTTVDGATINAWIGQFSIQNRYSAGALRPTTAGRTLDVTATGAAGVDWGNVENAGTTVDLSATSINLCDTVTTLTGHTAQTGDSFARLGAPAGASIAADIATVDSAVDALPGKFAIADQVLDELLSEHTTAGSLGKALADIEVDTTEIGAAGAGLSAIPWNAAWDVEVQSEVSDAMVAGGLDHLVSAAVTGTDIADNSIVARLVSSSVTADWDSYDNTTDSLQAARDHVGDGSNLTEAGGTGDQLTALATATNLATVDTVVDGIASAVGTPSDFGSGTSTIAANLQDIADNGTAVFDRSTDSLQAIRDHVGDGSNLTEAGGTGDQLTALATAASVSALNDISAADVWAAATRTLTAGTNLNDISVADVLTTQMTESYNADGVAPTLAQALHLIIAYLTERSVTGTTVTAKRLDGATTAATFTLDDGTTPTSVTRAT